MLAAKAQHGGDQGPACWELRLSFLLLGYVESVSLDEAFNKTEFVTTTSSVQIMVLSKSYQTNMSVQLIL